LKKQAKTQARRGSTLRRLIWANVIAFLALLTTSVVVLWALGLLQSIFAFLF
jgi:hypothetical protein